MFDEEYLNDHPEERPVDENGEPITFEANGRAGFIVPEATMETLSIDFLNKRLNESKRKLIAKIKQELLLLILEQTDQGKSVFNSVEYPKHQGYNEHNPHSCITNEEADEIVTEFLSKGIFVTHSVLNQKAVVFSFNLQKVVDPPSSRKS